MGSGDGVKVPVVVVRLVVVETGVRLVVDTDVVCVEVNDTDNVLD